MAAVAAGLAERGIATLRYQFPYMERGGKRPDPPKLAHAAVRAAVAEAARLLPKLPLIAGGKSFGGRMTSQAQAAGAAAGRARPGVPRLSAASGRSSRRASAPSICSTCRSRCCSCKAPATRWPTLDQLEPLCQELGARATLRAVRGRRSFVPRAGAERPHRCAGDERDAGRVRGPGPRPSSADRLLPQLLGGEPRALDQRAELGPGDLADAPGRRARSRCRR